MSTIWVSDHIKNKHTLYRGKNYMNKFCCFLRKYAKNIIAFEKKKNVIIKKRRTKITSRCISMLNL